MTDTTAQAAPVARRHGIRWGLVAGAVLSSILLLAASLLFWPPAFFFTALLQRAVHEQTGKELSVASSKYKLREIVTIELNDVELGEPGSQPGSSLFAARRVVARAPLRSLIDGAPQILSLDLEAPVFNFVRQPHGTGNWQITAASPPPSARVSAVPLPPVLPPTTIRNGTLIYTDEGRATQIRFDTIEASIAADQAYGGAAARGSMSYKDEPLRFDLAVTDAAAALAGRVTTLALTIDSRILKARLSGEAAIGESPMLAGEIEASTPSARNLAAWLGFPDTVPATAGALTFTGSTDKATTSARGRGNLVLRDTPVTYDLTLASLRAAIAGEPSKLTADLSGQGLQANLDGTLQLGAAPSYQGALTATTQSIGALATRLGLTNRAVTALKAGSLSGTVDARAGAISFKDTSFDADGRTGTYTGDISLAGPRPRLSGRLEVSKLDLDALLGRTPPPPPSLAAESAPPDEGFETTYDVLSAELDAFETAARPETAFQAQQTAAAQPSASPWSSAPIDLRHLRVIDLDLDLTVATVKFGQIPLTGLLSAVKLDNGDLSAAIDRVTVGAGTGAGSISVKARGSSHDAVVALDLKGVEAEPLSYELSGKPLLKGLSDVEIRTRASGPSLAGLVSTLDGNARIDMKKGQLRGWDLGRMVAELWNYKGWGYTPSRNTPVDELTANYTIKSGTVRSAPDLTMKGPTAGLRAVGDVIVPRRLIDQNVDVQNLFFNIVIKGDWTKKLWIGPSFLAARPSPPGVAPQAASKEPPPEFLPSALPADLQERINRILTDAKTASRLNEQQKSFLTNLLQRSRSGS